MTTTELRALMINVTNGRVLLPNANVTEIISYSSPEPVEGAPAWLLGRLRWRGWRVPVISFSILTGLATREIERNAKVTVLKALGGNPRLPYLAMMAQGFPRLTNISPDALIPTGEGEFKAPGVMHNTILRDDSAVVPNLFEIEDLVADVLQLGMDESALS
ncbi:MAG: chemotaxis protein CheW [Lysobacterales bacterium]